MMTFWGEMMTCEAEALQMEREAHTLRTGFQFHRAQNDGFQGIITDKAGMPKPHFFQQALTLPGVCRVRQGATILRLGQVRPEKGSTS